MTFFFLFLLNNCWLCRDISYKIPSNHLYYILNLFYNNISEESKYIFTKYIYIYKKETNIAQNYHKCIR